MSTVVKIGTKEYELSPLRLKQLKKIASVLESGTLSPTTGGYGEIDKWLPFILDSVKVSSPNVTIEELEEMSLQEFLDTWNTLIAMSGIKMVSQGEKTPMVSTGASSTPDSASPSAGDIVM